MELNNRQSALPCEARAVRRLLRSALSAEGRDAELSIALVEDAEMALLNRRFLGREGPTDVLAFPYESDGTKVSGELVVNAQAAVREAAGRSHGAEAELMLYLVHGLLHLLGYDDAAPEQAEKMHRRERELLRAAGYDVKS